MLAGDILPRSPRLISNLYVALLVTVYAVTAAVVAPGLYSDSGWGFLVADSMERGAAFNHLVEPDEDLARDTSWFVALWSPAQYIVPRAFEWLGLSLGSALVVTATLFTVSGLIGWRALYRSWGFAPPMVAIALVLVASSRATALPFGIYNGGEVLLFGTAPWFLLLLGRWGALGLRQAAGLLMASAIVVFVKLSGLVLVLAALAAAVVYDLWPPSLARLRRPLMAAAIVVVLGAAFHLLWLSRGATAVALGDNDILWAEAPVRFVQGCAAAVFGMFSLGDLTRRLLQHPPHPILASLDTLYLVGAVPAIALMAFVFRRLRAAHRDYVRFALAMGSFYLAIMAAIFVHNGDGLAFVEDRFYRPLSLTLLIGAVHAIATAGAALRVPFAALAAFSVAYGVASYFVRAEHNLGSPLGTRGVRHHILSHDGLALIRQELAGPFERADTVVWVISPETALELPHVRVIPTGDEPEDLAARSYAGRVGKLFVLVPSVMVPDGRADTMLRAFKDYDPARWTRKSLGDFTLYSQ